MPRHGRHAMRHRAMPPSTAKFWRCNPEIARNLWETNRGDANPIQKLTIAKTNERLNNCPHPRPSNTDAPDKMINNTLRATWAYFDNCAQLLQYATWPPYNGRWATMQ
eukprot:9581880-Lingulodinium_polyedra.AAC.1